MPTINLLPPEKIKHAQKLYLFLFLRILTEIFLVFMAMLSIFVIAARLLLADSAKEAVGKTSEINENYQVVKERVKEVNSFFKNTRVIIEAGSITWSQIYYNLLTALPPAVNLTNISVQRGGEHIEIAGVAKTRAALLEFKAALDKIPNLTDLQIPIPNLAVKENINFEITVKLKP